METHEQVEKRALNERLGRDGRMIVRFYNHGVPDVDKTNETGQPWFKEVLYVMRKHPDDRDFISRPATQQNIDEHPQEYQEFLDSKKSQYKISVLMIPGVTPAIVAAFRHAKIFTFDQLVAAESLPDQLKPFQEQAARMWSVLKPRHKLEAAP